MKYKLTKQPTGLDIQITETQGQEQELLAAFQLCQEGRCSCPTDEYQKLERLEVQTEGGQIRLRLTPKPEATLDHRAIERCLNFTFQQVEASDKKSTTALTKKEL